MRIKLEGRLKSPSGSIRKYPSIAFLGPLITLQSTIAKLDDPSSG
jgi:hypothetical protein